MTRSVLGKRKKSAVEAIPDAKRHKPVDPSAMYDLQRNILHRLGVKQALDFAMRADRETVCEVLVDVPIGCLLYKSFHNSLMRQEPAAYAILHKGLTLAETPSRRVTYRHSNSIEFEQRLGLYWDARRREVEDTLRHLEWMEGDKKERIPVNLCSLVVEWLPNDGGFVNFL